ncbi:MAG: HpcH/HpaI aldolase/citrate lyase family protein [Gammaproteobacteria bacterium]
MTAATTPMRRRLDAGEVVLCLCLTHARTADVPMMAAACGFDAVFLDLEHAPIGVDTAAMLCTAAIGAGVTPLVRVPAHDTQYMIRLLDNGAMGVIVPHVEDRAQAEAIVEACRFAPIGRRSIIGPNPATGFRPMPIADMNAFMNREQIVCAMIETPGAVERAGEIASVPGLDMILIGPHDLTSEMGIHGQFGHERFRAAVAAVAAACRTHGTILGIAGVGKDADLLAEFLALGGRFISAGTDAGFFMEAARAQVARLRGIDIPAAPPTYG